MPEPPVSVAAVHESRRPCWPGVAVSPGRLNAGPPRTSKPDPGKRSRPFWDDITPHLYAPSDLQKRTLTGPVKVRNEWVMPTALAAFTDNHEEQ